MSARFMCIATKALPPPDCRTTAEKRRVASYKTKEGKTLLVYTSAAPPSNFLKILILIHERHLFYLHKLFFVNWQSHNICIRPTPLQRAVCVLLLFEAKGEAVAAARHSRHNVKFFLA